MEMLASTQLLVAGPELGATPLVERVTTTPPIVTEPVAAAVTVFTVEEFTVTVQVRTLPVPERALHAVGTPSMVGLIVKLLTVWSPGTAVRVIVKVCEWPTSFTALGPIWMLVST